MNRRTVTKSIFARTHKLLIACCSGLVLAITAFSSIHAASANPGPLRGEGGKLFSGQAGLQAFMVGHQTPLPAEASKCSNCHQADIKQGVLAPKLTAAQLTDFKPRRGGPASRFDAISLCKLLREGIDPAWVVINTTMPRYRISDQQCASLWTYLANAP